MSEKLEKPTFNHLEPMTLEVAEWVRELKRTCTYRYLAEQFYPADHWGHGNQLAGMDLCSEACKVLGINPNYWPFGVYPEFDKKNKSHIGDFYWWE